MRHSGAVTADSAPVSSTTPTATGAATAREPAGGKMCVAEIDRRIVALDGRQHELVNAQHLSDADRAALDANIDQARSGLRTLRAQIAAETDPAALKTECDTVWTGYRVFALVLPRTRLVTVADSEQFAGGPPRRRCGEVAGCHRQGQGRGPRRDQSAVRPRRHEDQDRVGHSLGVRRSRRGATTHAGRLEREPRRTQAVPHRAEKRA
jgi:hypothetical protein